MTTKTKTAKKIDITIKPHPRYPETHSIAIVTVRGRCYFVTWADVPTEDQVAAAWRETRSDFQPYNCTMWS